MRMCTTIAKIYSLVTVMAPNAVTDRQHKSNPDNNKKKSKRRELQKNYEAGLYTIRSSVKSVLAATSKNAEKEHS